MSALFKPSRLRWVRWAFMSTHALLIILLTLISVFFTLDLLLLIFHLASALAMLVYLPAATILAVRRSESSRYDHAGGEVAYLSVQAGLWTASAIIAGITGGPGICHTALYDSGRLASSFPTHLAEINALIVTCRTLAAITALSVCHVVLILCWIGLDVYVVYTTISTSTSTMSRAAAFKLPMWKLIRGEYRRVDVLELGEANKVDQYGVGGSGQDGYSYGSRNRMGTGAEQEPKPGMEAESEPIYSYGQSQARHGMTTTQHNPFENSYEDDDAGAFDNPFERDQARGQDGGYRQSASERRGMYGPVSTRGE